jgi:Helix-turn-helix domain of resolvase
MGRKPNLTPHQVREALQRRQDGEPIREIARTYNVSDSTISRLATRRVEDMDRDEIGKILAEGLGKRRGYADFFDWLDKSIKEWGVAKEFCKELERDGGPKIVSQKQHPGGRNHAPDYQVTTDAGEIWGLELTELVSQKAIEATKRNRSYFAMWSDEDLITKFETLVAKKDCLENVKGGPYDRYILLVHVDEDMLPVERLKAVLGSRSFQTRFIDEHLRADVVSSR